MCDCVYIICVYVCLVVHASILIRRHENISPAYGLTTLLASNIAIRTHNNAILDEAGGNSINS